MKKLYRVVLLVTVVCLMFYSYGRLRNITNNITIEHFSIYEDGKTTTPASVQIATYNIAHGRGAVLNESNWNGATDDKETRLKSIGKYFKDNNTDILVLNEIDFSASWSGNLDQASIIANSGEFPYIARQVNYDLLLPGFSLKFGNAILSRFPIDQAFKKTLPALSQIEAMFFGNHDAVEAHINLTPKIKITVWGLHLEVRNEEVRIQAINEILSEVSTDNLIVLAGDLNSKPPENKINTAFNELTRINFLEFYPKLSSSTYTFPSTKPNRTLDWVFYSSQFIKSEAEVPLVDYSDHLPVIIKLELNNLVPAADGR